MTENDAKLYFLEDLESPPSDTLNASLSSLGLPEYPLYPSPASDVSLKSLTVGGWGAQHEDGLTPSPYYAMLGCTVHFRYQDLQARLVSVSIFCVGAERLKISVSLALPLKADIQQRHPV